MLSPSSRCLHSSGAISSHSLIMLFFSVCVKDLEKKPQKRVLLLLFFCRRTAPTPTEEAFTSKKKGSVWSCRWKTKAEERVCFNSRKAASTSSKEYSFCTNFFSCEGSQRCNQGRACPDPFADFVSNEGQTGLFKK